MEETFISKFGFCGGGAILKYCKKCTKAKVLRTAAAAVKSLAFRSRRRRFYRRKALNKFAFFLAKSITELCRIAASF